MVRQAVTRLAGAAGVTAAVVALAIGAGGPASAAPKAASSPTTVQLVGDGVSDKIVVDKSTQPRLFETVYDEVSWLSSVKPQTTAPPASKLGPKYTLTVLVKNVPT